MGINMIDDMNDAWNDMREKDVATNRKYVVNLLSHSFVAVDKEWRAFCKEKNYKYDNDTFYLYQKLLIKLMFCDGDFLQSEYDAYCDFCDWANFEELSVSDCKSCNGRVTGEELVQAIQLLINLRGAMGEDNYHYLAMAFCHFALLSDRAMDEDEYYIIRCFYVGNSDYAPSTWEKFKKEWV